MIGGARESCTHAGFDAELLGVDIDDSEQLMRLFRRGQEMADTAEVIVFLQRHLVLLRQGHRDPAFRDEFKLRKTIPGVVDDGIEDEIEAARMNADDAANFGRICPLIPMRGIEAEFQIDAVKEFPLRRIRGDEQGAKLESIVCNAAIACDRIQREIETSLEPRCDAVSPLGGAIERVVRDDATRNSSG